MKYVILLVAFGVCVYTTGSIIAQESQQGGSRVVQPKVYAQFQERSLNDFRENEISEVLESVRRSAQTLGHDGESWSQGDISGLKSTDLAQGTPRISINILNRWGFAFRKDANGTLRLTSFTDLVLERSRAAQLQESPVRNEEECLTLARKTLEMLGYTESDFPVFRPTVIPESRSDLVTVEWKWRYDRTKPYFTLTMSSISGQCSHFHSLFLSHADRVENEFRRNATNGENVTYLSRCYEIAAEMASVLGIDEAREWTSSDVTGFMVVFKDANGEPGICAVEIAERWLFKLVTCSADSIRVYSFKDTHRNSAFLKDVEQIGPLLGRPNMSSSEAVSAARDCLKQVGVSGEISSHDPEVTQRKEWVSDDRGYEKLAEYRLVWRVTSSDVGDSIEVTIDARRNRISGLFWTPCVRTDL